MATTFNAFTRATISHCNGVCRSDCERAVGSQSPYKWHAILGVPRPEDRKTGEIFREVEPEDLLKYGLIPEFVGRLPVVATLEDLDEPSLKLILTQPKNALVKQYQQLFEMESIDLTLAEEALSAIARKAIDRSL